MQADSPEYQPCSDGSEVTAEVALQADESQPPQLALSSSSGALLGENLRAFAPEADRHCVDVLSDDLSENKALLRDLFHNLDASSDGETIDLEAGSVIELYRRVLSFQDTLVRSVVEVAAAIQEHGDSNMSLDCALLQVVLRESAVEPVLCAQQWGLLTSVNDAVQFPHSLLRAAAYASISETKLASLHLKIGRRLWKEMQESTEEVDSTRLLVIAKQLQQSVSAVNDISELGVIALVQLRAGQHAARSSEFKIAANFFEHGIAALGISVWNAENYEVSLDLHNACAEASYCVGNFERMDVLLDAVFQQARSFRDKLQAYTTLVYANGARNLLAEAVRVALDVLTDLGEPFPASPGKFTLMCRYLKTERMLRGKTDQYFLSLPMATSHTTAVTMTMLSFVWWYGSSVKPEHAALAIFRMLSLAIKDGITGPAAMAFSCYGALLSFFGKVDQAYRFGQLSLALLDKCEAKAWIPRTHLVVYGIINVWSCPFRDSLEPLKSAHQAALQTGDIQASTICATTHVILAFNSGQSVVELEEIVRAYCAQMSAFGQMVGLVYLVPFWECLNELMGDARGVLSLSGSVVDSASACAQAQKEGNRHGESLFYVLRTIVCTFLGDYNRALAAGKKAREFMPYLDHRLSFYHGLSSFAAAWSATGRAQRKLVAFGIKTMKELQEGSPNQQHMMVLLQAELAALRGKVQSALTLFGASIKAAQKERFVQTEGLAYERLAHYHRFLGIEPAATAYFARSRDCYRMWGAGAVVSRIEQYIADEQLFPGSTE
jgi:tetratricopeptide (TPR) repeat protein